MTRIDKKDSDPSGVLFEVTREEVLSCDGAGFSYYTERLIAEGYETLAQELITEKLKTADCTFLEDFLDQSGKLPEDLGISAELLSHMRAYRTVGQNITIDQGWQIVAETRALQVSGRPHDLTPKVARETFRVVSDNSQKACN